MNDDEKWEMFLIFLDIEGALEHWKENGGCKVDYAPPNLFLAHCGFTWMLTEQGRDYWDKLSFKWEGICKNL